MRIGKWVFLHVGYSNWRPSTTSRFTGKKEKGTRLTNIWHSNAEAWHRPLGYMPSSLTHGRARVWVVAHSTVSVCHRARFGALPQKGKNEKRLDQSGFEKCRRGTGHVV